MNSPVKTHKLIIAFLGLVSLQCTDITEPSLHASISVFVHWQEMPIAGKKVEILDTGEEKLTNEHGLAEFNVMPGSYTVRVYSVNRGGPCCGYVDYEVTVERSEMRRIEVVDCLDCV